MNATVNPEIAVVAHDTMANSVRLLALDAVESKVGHRGMPMGMVEVATAAFARFLKFDVDETKRITVEAVVEAARTLTT